MVWAIYQYKEKNNSAKIKLNEQKTAISVQGFEIAHGFSLVSTSLHLFYHSQNKINIFQFLASKSISEDPFYSGPVSHLV